MIDRSLGQFPIQTCAFPNVVVSGQVTVTNLTFMQPFSPLLLVAHTEVRCLREFHVDWAEYRVYGGSRAAV